MGIGHYISSTIRGKKAIRMIWGQQAGGDGGGAERGEMRGGSLDLLLILLQIARAAERKKKEK